MTDEEMAIEWVKDNADSCRSQNMNAYDFATQAFLGGLKAGSQLDKVWQDYDAGEDCYEDSHEGKWVKREAGGLQWHKVADGDLPKPNIAVLICLQFEKWTTTYIAYYRPAIKKWQMYNMHEAQRQPIVDDYIDSDEVVAWCEIPQYTEE